MEGLEDGTRLFMQGLLSKTSDQGCVWLSLSNTGKGVTNEVKTLFSSRAPYRIHQVGQVRRVGDKTFTKVSVDLILHKSKHFAGPSS